MQHTHFQRPPSPVPLHLPARKHSTSMQHFCLTDAPGQYSLLQIGISVTPMPINSFLLRLRQQTGDFLPFTLENEFSVLNTMQTPAAKWNPACSLTAILVLWAMIIEVSGKGEEEVLLHHSKNCTLGLLYKVPRWQQSSFHTWLCYCLGWPASKTPLQTLLSPVNAASHLG